MTILKDRLETLLTSFDEQVEPFSEEKVAEAIKKLHKEALPGDNESRFILQYEQMAFEFTEDYSNDKNNWGTYYGPMWVLPDANGQWFESPSIHLITSDMLDYWKKRSENASHPLLRIRYADLVWDFTDLVIKTKPDIRVAQIVVDATLEFVADHKYYHEIAAIKKIKRALSIALSISDKKRIEAVKQAMLALEDEIGDDNKPGLWGFSFDNLFLNKKVELSQEEREKILNDLELRLSRLSEKGTEPLRVHAIESVTLRLARHYRTASQLDDMHRVLRIYGRSVIDVAKTAGAIAGSTHLQKLYYLFYDFGMKEDANELSGLMSELNAHVKDEMQEHSQTFEIPKEEIEKYLEALIAGSLEDVLKRITVHYIPDMEETEKQVREFVADSPLTFLINKSIVDGYGRPIAEIGSVEEDFDGHVVLQLSQNMQIEANFLRLAIKRMIDKFNVTQDILLDYLYKSPVFQIEYRSILGQGLDAFLKGEIIASTHILVPQIENTLRHLLKISGGSIYKPNRVGGISLRILDEILRDKAIEAVLTENVAKYFRVLLTDQRGWNIRNDICHGMMHPSRFNSAVADRLLHVLLFLAIIKEKKESSPET